jgi:hypothetical protein
MRDALQDLRNINEVEQILLKPEILDGNLPFDRKYGMNYYTKLWLTVQETSANLSVEALEAEVVWGPKAEELVRPFKYLEAELFQANLQYNSLLKLHSRNELEEKNFTDASAKLSAVGPDQISGKVLSAVRKIEDVARPHLNLKKWSVWK